MRPIRSLIPVRGFVIGLGLLAATLGARAEARPVTERLARPASIGDAIASYRRSLELNPQNNNGVQMLKKLGAPPR